MALCNLERPPIPFPSISSPHTKTVTLRLGNGRIPPRRRKTGQCQDEGGNRGRRLCSENLACTGGADCQLALHSMPSFDATEEIKRFEPGVVRWKMSIATSGNANA